MHTDTHGFLDTDNGNRPGYPHACRLFNPAPRRRISYPRQTIRNVGDAVHHTLLRTGWRLNESTLTGEARDVLVMPLPDSQRVVGPYEVRTILHVLLGNSWVWCEDPVRRTVTFMLRDGAGATCPTGATFSDSTAAAPAVPMAVQLPQVEEILNEGEN